MKKRKYKFVDYAEDGSIAVNAIKLQRSRTTLSPWVSRISSHIHACSRYSCVSLHLFLHRYFNASHERLRSDQSYPSPRKQIFAAMIIALTGLASSRDQSEGFLAGFDIYMTKPVSFKALGKLLDSWETNRNSYSERYKTPI